MKTLSLQASDHELLAAVDEWVKLLAAERYQDAYDFLYHGGDARWTPKMIERAINNYGGAGPHWSGTTFKVAWPEADEENGETDGDADNADEESGVTRYEPGTTSKGVVGEILYGLPLNGEWSSLTAVVTFREMNRSLVFQLDDIHVL